MESHYYGYPWSNPTFSGYQHPKPSPKPRSRVISIPVQFINSDSPATPPLEKQAPPAPALVVISREAAAVRLQRATRSFLVRKNLRLVRKIHAEAEEIGRKIDSERDILKKDKKARIGIGEMLMSLLFRLDSVRGVRDYRKKVIRRVISMQETVDSMASSMETEVSNDESNPVETLEMEESVERLNLSSEIAQQPPQSDQTMEESGSAEAVHRETTEAPHSVQFDASHGEKVGSPNEESGMEGEEKEIVGVQMEENKPEGTGEEIMEMRDSAQIDAPNGAELGIEEAARKEKETGSGEMEGKVMREVLERMVVESEKMKGLMQELHESSVQQWRLMEGLVDRVQRLESMVQRMERKNRRRKGNSNKRCAQLKQQLM